MAQVEAVVIALAMAQEVVLDTEAQVDLGVVMEEIWDHLAQVVGMEEAVVDTGADMEAREVDLVAREPLVMEDLDTVIIVALVLDLTMEATGPPAVAIEDNLGKQGSLS